MLKRFPFYTEINFRGFYTMDDVIRNIRSCDKERRAESKTQNNQVGQGAKPGPARACQSAVMTRTLALTSGIGGKEKKKLPLT